MKTIVADVTKVSVSSVKANYAEDTTRPIDNKAIIKVIITAENLDEEKNILEKVAYSTLFVSEINDGLAAYNTTLLSVSEMERVHAYLG